MKITIFMRSLALLVLAALSAPAMATYPDIDGTTWTGTDSGSDFGCSNPADDGPYTEDVIVTFSNQVGSNFDVTMLWGDDQDISTGSGYFTSATQIQFTVTDDHGGGDIDTDYVTADGIDGNTASFTSSGYNTGGDNCSWSGSGTMSRSSSEVIITPEAAPSTSVTNNAQALATSVTTTTGFLNARVQSALQGSQHVGVSRAGRGFMAEASGLSAGDTFNNIGMWASYAYTDFENDFSRTKYDGDTDTFFVGIDFTPSDNAVLGIAIGYEDTNTDTDFNGGKSDADGYTFAPYFGMTLDETWSFDLMGGYSSIDIDQYRLGLVGGAPVGARITSDVDTKRYFFSGNINGFTSIDQWRLSGRVGAMMAKGRDEEFTESDGTAVANRSSELSQFSLGGEAAYAFDEFEPFASVAYNYDMTKIETQFLTGSQPSNDDDDFLVGVGFRYFGENGLSVSAQYDARLGRSDYDEDTFSVNARWDF